MVDQFRAAWVDVDLDAIRHNVQVLCAVVSPSEVCAAIKADGYGHGDVEVARAAMSGGATRLGVALVEEGLRLRGAGIDAPIVVLSEPPTEAMSAVVAGKLIPAIYSASGAAALSRATKEPYPAHVKVDTGMNRVGIHYEDAVPYMKALPPNVEIEGMFTHFAVADEPSNGFTKIQGERFSEVVAAAARVGIAPPLLHACNSAGGLLHPEYRYSFVRFGIALYGVSCSTAVPLHEDLRPAMSVRAEVSYSKIVAAGEAMSYGQRYRVDRPTRIVTVPVGYADGVPRLLGSNGGEVLIRGKRRPIAGTVTMDQITVDCGDDQIEAGEEVVLIGQQGAERISAEDWGTRTGTIGYEITCRIGPRLPRRYDFGR